MNETWDVPDDHFTENVLKHHLGYRTGLSEDERFFVRTKGNWSPDISDSAFDKVSGVRYGLMIRISDSALER